MADQGQEEIYGPISENPPSFFCSGECQDTCCANKNSIPSLDQNEEDIYGPVSENPPYPSSTLECRDACCANKNNPSLTNKNEDIYGPALENPPNLLGECQDSCCANKNNIPTCDDTCCSNQNDSQPPENGHPPGELAKHGHHHKHHRPRKDTSIGLDDAEITTTLFKVEGMTCTGCARTLEDHLESLPGIRGIMVSFVTSRAQIKYSPQLLNDQQIATHIELLQFQASPITCGIPLVLSLLQPTDRNIQRMFSFFNKFPGIQSSSLFLNETDKSTFKVLYDQELTGGRLITDALAKALPDITTQVESISFLTDIEKSKNDPVKRWFNYLMTASFLCVPLAISAFILMQVSSTRAIYMQPLFRGTVLITRVFSECPFFLLFMPIGLPIRFFVEFILASPLQLWFAIPIYESAWGAFRYAFTFDMDSLVVISTSVAYFYSVGIILAIIILNGTSASPLLEETFFETSGILLTLIFLGRYLEVLAKRNTSDAVSSLFTFQSTQACLMEGDGQTRMIPSELIQRSDMIKIFPGSKIPADGVVVSGISHVDESVLTGESKLLLKEKGSSLFSGTLNQNGMIIMQVKAIQGETVLDEIIEHLQKTQMGKAPIERITDALASKFVPFVVFVAVSVFILWFCLSYFGVVVVDAAPAPFALHFFLAVLIVSCPCALGLAAPVPVLVGTEMGAKNHLLFKGGDVLESCAKVNAVCFDKTGTLTTGKLVVTEIIQIHEATPEDVLFYATCAENGSEHPISKAILHYASTMLPEYILKKTHNASSTKAHPGRGVQTSYEDKDILVGNAEFLTENSIDISFSKNRWENDQKHTAIKKSRELGNTALFVAFGGNFIGAIMVADQLRPNAEQVIQILERQGYEIWMISGDHESTCHVIGKRLGIQPSNICAGVTPKGKAIKVEEIQARGKHVLMIGDGINDAVCLSQADVGMVVGSASDIALDVSDVAMMHDNIYLVLVALDLSKKVHNVIKWNIGWAIVYNLIALPIAAGILQYPWGISIPPVIAGLNELLSSLPVIGFSLLFLRFYSPPTIDDAVELDDVDDVDVGEGESIKLLLMKPPNYQTY